MRFFGLLALIAAVLLQSEGCRREPDEQVTRSLKTPGDNGFRIYITGEPEKYIPGAIYTLVLHGARTHGRLQKFSRFILSALPSGPGVNQEGMVSPQRVGSFQLFGDGFTSFSEWCVNTVTQADTLPKTEVQVMWTAPAKGSGCVTFKAMVFENAENWYADEGGLEREMCELIPPRRGPPTSKDESSERKGECCACDEAKYRFVFEGLWSNETHPKDFPSSLWLTHFSDVIGATHTPNYTMWKEGGYATDGIQQVAEWGSVRGMEHELRQASRHLRTLIKATGLWYPNVNANTTASFRVDKRHYLLSLVSMLGPTPDWILGVSDLNLCLEDCSWMETKTIDLFPYDAGTDSGISYMSPNEPTNPKEKIRRITTLYPEDPRAPFYDPRGGEMTPIARLYLTRERIIPKGCEEPTLDQLIAETLDEIENTEESERPECQTTEYSAWSPCSVSCGKGLRMRTRSYRMEAKAKMFRCDRQLVSKEMCVSDTLPTCPGDEDEETNGLLGSAPQHSGVCETSDWSQWSECSVTCGAGIEMRTRHFVDRMGIKKCPGIPLVDKRKCMMALCSGPAERLDPECPVTSWSDWSPCSATCDKGVKLRTRLLLVSAEDQQRCSERVELLQQRPCVGEQATCRLSPSSAKQVCSLPVLSGPCRGYFERWAFDEGICRGFIYGGCRGNRNNFLTETECKDACHGYGEYQPIEALGPQSEIGYLGEFSIPRVDCMVTDWSVWTECSVTCGTGFRERFRHIKAEPRNGGKPCPRRLVKKRPCAMPSCANF